MIIAVFARTLLPDVPVERFVRAWAPESDEPYPAEVEVAVDHAHDRRVLTIIRFDGSRAEFDEALPRLLHPQARQRVTELVESTALEGIYESVAVTV